MDDKFVNLGQEIQNAVQRVLDSKSLADLEVTINDTVRRTTQKVADSARKATGAAACSRAAAHTACRSAGDSRGTISAAAPFGPLCGAGGLSTDSDAAENLRARLGGQRVDDRRRLSGSRSFRGSVPGRVDSTDFRMERWESDRYPADGSFFQRLPVSDPPRRIRRFVQYQSVIQGRSFCTVSELTAATGATADFVVKDLRKMLQLRMFPEGYLNAEGTSFMLDYATFQQYQQAEERSRRRQEELDSNPEKAAIQQMLTEGGAYIRRIREINLELPAEDISRKLDTLETVTGKIFVYVEKHPNKLPQIRKFLCYYLPTTLKLVEAYRDLEKQHADSKSAGGAKEEIQGALDKINLAFQTLLDNLMQDDLLDLSADISTLETMMAQEGLTGLNFRQS